MCRDGDTVLTLNKNYGTIDDFVDRYADAISASTKGFSFRIDKEDLVVIANSEKPKSPKRKHLTESINFVNYSVGKNKTSGNHFVNLKNMELYKFLEEIKDIGCYVDDKKSKKTIILGQKYFFKLKRKSKKALRTLEKKINNETATRSDLVRLTNLKKIQGAKYTKHKTTEIYDSFKGTPIYISLNCTLGEFVDKKNNVKHKGRIYISFEPINNVREIYSRSSSDSIRYGYEVGVSVNISYRGWNKKLGKETMDKVKCMLEDVYLGPLVEKFRNSKKEEIYFIRTTFIDKIKNYEVEGDSFEGSNGIKLLLPSQDIKSRGFRDRKMNKIRKEIKLSA